MEIVLIDGSTLTLTNVVKLGDGVAELKVSWVKTTFEYKRAYPGVTERKNLTPILGTITLRYNTISSIRQADSQ